MKETLESLIGITLDQLADALEDENTRKKIKDILSDKIDWSIVNKYFIGDCMYPKKFHTEYASTFRSFNTFNRYETEEDAIMMSKRLNAEQKLFHIAKFLNKEWTPNWNDENEYKFYLCYSENRNDDERFYLKSTYFTNYGIIYFKSADMVSDIIRLMDKQSLKEYFMIGK